MGNPSGWAGPTQVGLTQVGHRICGWVVKWNQKMKLARLKRRARFRKGGARVGSASGLLASLLSAPLPGISAICSLILSRCYMPGRFEKMGLSWGCERITARSTAALRGGAAGTRCARHQRRRAENAVNSSRPAAPAAARSACGLCHHRPGVPPRGWSIRAVPNRSGHCVE